MKAIRKHRTLRWVSVWCAYSFIKMVGSLERWCSSREDREPIRSYLSYKNIQWRWNRMDFLKGTEALTNEIHRGTWGFGCLRHVESQGSMIKDQIISKTLVCFGNSLIWWWWRKKFTAVHPFLINPMSMRRTDSSLFFIVMTFHAWLADFNAVVLFRYEVSNTEECQM